MAKKSMIIITQVYIASLRSQVVEGGEYTIIYQFYINQALGGSNTMRITIIQEVGRKDNRQGFICWGESIIGNSVWSILPLGGGVWGHAPPGNF